MAKLTILTCKVLARAGDNKAQHIGIAAFSDGKAYTWIFDHLGNDLEFQSSRGHSGFKESFHFRSPKRATLVKEWLDRSA